MSRTPPRAVLLATLLLLAAAPAAYAYPPAQPQDPDWPCQQIRISELQAAAVWAGPPVDTALHTWSQDPEVAALATSVSERRVPLDEVRKEIVAFAAKAGPQKQTRLVALFAGVFDTLNDERESVIAGLDRFGRRQKELAQEIKGDEEKLRVMQDDPKADDKKLGDLTQQVTWEEQVYKDRQESVSTACDVPSVIEQRLFAVARIIQEQMH